ncbi:hypothetical protein ACFL5V_04965 [Fibrobacterota bacterium]
MFQIILHFSIIVLSALVFYFLAIIAKFYRLKSGIGIHHNYFVASGISFILGQSLSLEKLPMLFSHYLSPILIISGGAGLIILSLSLYRNMMSVQKNT